MEKRGPVLVGIGLIGALSGVLVAGHGNAPGVVSAAPTAQLQVIPTSTSIVASEAPVPSAGSSVATTVESASTTAVIVASEAAVAPTTEATTTAPPVVVDTVDIPPPLGPDPTLDLPAAPPPSSTEVPATQPPAADDEEPTTPLDPPWAAGTDRATVRLVVANADLRPDLDEVTVQRLTTRGYGNITTAADLTPSAFTTIYYREGFNRAAVTLAIDLDAAEVSLEPMPATPVTDIDDQGDLIAVLGPDVPIG